MYEIHSLIEREHFFHFFQPLFYLLNRDKCGYEGLLRSEVCRNPEVLFRKAKEARKLYDLDTKSIAKAVLSFCEAGADADLLFLNIFPSTLMHPCFRSFLEKLMQNVSITPGQIVFEINEAEIVTDTEALRQAVVFLKRDGFLIALDDVGKGSASFRTVVELEPAFVKLDRYFSTDLHKSEKKQKMIQAFVNYCRDEAQLVLEGIETQEELAAARSLGVTIGQGYLLGKPGLLQGNDA
ncbi:EAL domain-containing protein [Bacillaceae bacterium]